MLTMFRLDGSPRCCCNNQAVSTDRHKEASLYIDFSSIKTVSIELRLPRSSGYLITKARKASLVYNNVNVM